MSTRTNDYGAFYEADGLVNAIKSLNTMDSNTRMLYLALIMAMENFIKENKLKKELYLISDNEESDLQNADTMLVLTKNLNHNISVQSKGCLDNCVKVHCFSVENCFDFMRDLALATGGNFYNTNSSYEFKKQILTEVSGGKFDPKKIGAEIHHSKTHKIDPHDPSHPPKSN